LDAGIDARREGLEGRSRLHQRDVMAAADHVQPHGSLVLPELQFPDIGDVPERQVALFEVKLMRDVAQLELVGQWQNQQAIPLGVDTRPADLS
jgi:hypothetical protein